jgi:hypothetical protein
MKKILTGALVLIAIAAVAQDSAPVQQPAPPGFRTNLVERTDAPTYSDIYCAGFISKEKLNQTNQITATEAAPNETLAGNPTQIVLLSGSGYQEGQRFTVLRELRDPNQYEPYKGQRREVSEAGQPYAQLGRIKVLALRGSHAVAAVEFACQPMTTGDFLVPFQEHAPVSYKQDTIIEKYPSGPGKLGARIIMSNEFDFLVARGMKVFINAGSDKGVKVGDYFRAVRGYDPDKIDPVESLSYKSPVADDTQMHPGKVTREEAKTLPVRNLGEMIVLSVTPTSATAMITRAWESIEVGDHVELEGQ